MPAIHRGDVWWAQVPGDKRRPVVVLTRERFIPHLSSLLVAPVTTKVRGIPTEVVLDEADGLFQRCAASFDNVLTVGRADFDSRIAQLAPARMSEICQAYRFAAGC